MKRIMALTGLLLIGFVGFAYWSGFRVNTTDSFPLGVYQLLDRQAEKGDLVLYCPPVTALFAEAKNRGYFGYGFCEGFQSPLLKKLVAGSGDRVISTADGVVINGVLQPNSVALFQDRMGRTLPKTIINTTLPNGQILLLSDYHPRSFDSRYFGAVSGTGIIGAVQPVWVWEKEDRG